MEEKRPSKTTDTKNICSSIQGLPDILKIKIFSFLTLKDIVSVCLVCKEWNSLANSEYLWKIKCNRLPAVVGRGSLNDEEHGCRWKKIFKQNLARNNVRRTWHPDMFRNPASYDDLPQGMFSNMDVDSWADVLQLSQTSVKH